MVKPIFKPWLKITGVLEKGHEADTQMHQNCLYFGAITMFIEVHVADKPKSSKFSDLTLAWVCLKKGIPFRPILYLFAFF